MDTSAESEHLLAEQTRELKVLLDVSRMLTGTLELGPLLGLFLDKLGDVVEYTEAIVMLLDGDQFRVLDYRGPRPREETLAIRHPVRLEPLFHAILEADGPVIIDDASGDSELAVAVRTVGVPSPPRPTVAGRSMMGVPLKVKDRIVGEIGLDHAQPGFYSPAHAELVLAVANQAAAAIENARLFEDERLARERLEVALAAGQMGAWEWDIRTNAVTWSRQLEEIHGLKPGTFGGTFESYLAHLHPDDRADVRRALDLALITGEAHLEYRAQWPDGSTHWYEAIGRVITDREGQPIGMRGVCHDISARRFAEAERSRLYERERVASEARAALEERQRLARDLHDSVSQALYGVALGSQTVIGALEEDGDLNAAGDAARYVLKLAEAAIAEMRALIFELRPESLQQQGLLAALEQQAASAQTRHELHTILDLPNAEPDVPIDVKEALLRIAQEALHNAVRHARATQLRMSLRTAEPGVVLEIEDNGVGFDAAKSYPGHLGLTSMHERAGSIGADFDVHSEEGSGTRIVVQVKPG